MSEPRAGEARTPETRQQLVDAMSMEYTSLRSEIAERTNRRFQITTVLGIAGALLAGIKGELNLGVVGMAAGLACVAAGVWFSSGRLIGEVSAHLAELEKRIDDTVGFHDSPALTWERMRQDRGRWNRFMFGPSASKEVWLRGNHKKDEETRKSRKSDDPTTAKR